MPWRQHGLRGGRQLASLDFYALFIGVEPRGTRRLFLEAALGDLFVAARFFDEFVHELLVGVHGLAERLVLETRPFVLGVGIGSRRRVSIELLGIVLHCLLLFVTHRQALQRRIAPMPSVKSGVCGTIRIAAALPIAPRIATSMSRPRRGSSMRSRPVSVAIGSSADPKEAPRSSSASSCTNSTSTCDWLSAATVASAPTTAR